jgi:hypothetical protein
LCDEVGAAAGDGCPYIVRSTGVQSPLRVQNARYVRSTEYLYIEYSRMGRSWTVTLCVICVGTPGPSVKSVGVDMSSVK